MMSAENIASERPSRTRLAFQVFMLLLLLVITPAISWVYLRKGLDYRQEHLAVLDRMGPVRPGTWTNALGEPVSTETWKEQLTLVYLSGKDLPMDQRLPLLHRIESQFSDRPDVVLVHFMDQIDWERLEGGRDTPDWQVVPLGSEDLALLRQGWTKDLGREAGDRIILIDRHGQVRAMFDPASAAEVRSLVEVTAVMLPPKKVDRPTVQRESEK